MYHREHIRERNKGKKEKKSEKKERGKRKTNTAGGGSIWILLCDVLYDVLYF